MRPDPPTSVDGISPKLIFFGYWSMSGHQQFASGRRAITIITHDNPIGRDLSNYMIHADLSERVDGWREQLWTRRLTPDRFEITCLPFFTYGICHHDVVAIDDRHLVAAVVEKSGHRTLRVALVRQHPHRDQFHELLHSEVATSGLAHEWLQATYLSVDLPPGADPAPLVKILAGPEEIGALFWEIDS